MCDIHEIEFYEEREISGKQAYVFRVLDGTFTNPNIAMAVSSNTPLKKCPLKDIGLYGTLVIVSYLRSKLGDKRSMIVIDIDEFPFIKTYIDDRNQHEIYPEAFDKFSFDVKNTYDTYDQLLQIPVIQVNLDIMSTVLALIKFDMLKLVETTSVNES